MSSPFSVNWLVHRLCRQHLHRALVDFAHGRLLDVGCGRKPYLELQQGSAASCIGVDYDRCRYRDTPPQIWASLELPFRDESFETVFCAQVLEHTSEPGEMLREMGRVLKPRGHLILSAPHIWGIHEEPHDYFRFTNFGLKHLAGKAGLDTVKVEAMAGYWVTAGTRFCYYLEQFEKLGMKPVLLPLYAVVQILAAVLDRIHRVENDCWNFLLVARKPSNEKGTV
jgi:SAM-dependent methyltransferase